MDTGASLQDKKMHKIVTGWRIYRNSKIKLAFLTLLRWWVTNSFLFVSSHKGQDLQRRLRPTEVAARLGPRCPEPEMPFPPLAAGCQQKQERIREELQVTTSPCPASFPTTNSSSISAKLNTAHQFCPFREEALPPQKKKKKVYFLSLQFFRLKWALSTGGRTDRCPDPKEQQQ